MHSVYSSLESPWSTSYLWYLNFFRCLLRLRCHEQKSVKVCVFRRGWVTLSADFRGKEALLTNHCWCQKTRAIAVSCYEIICSPLFSFVTIHTSDRRTDRWTEFRQQYSALHYMQSHGKNFTCYQSKLMSLFSVS